MRIKILQKLIDIFRGKIFFNYKGKNNKIIALDKCKFNLIKLFAFSKIKIKGNNNTIIFKGDFKLKNYFNIIKQLEIYMYGNDNLIDIEFPIRFQNVLIGMEEHNNQFKIKNSKHKVRDARIFIAGGGIIKIGKNSQLKNRGLHIVVNNGYKKNPKLIMGDNVYIAKDAIIRASDGHTLIDAITKKALNEPEDIIIGNNVWITSRCTILKGTQIPNNCIIGACSLVNKKFTEENVIIAGSPAKIIKKNITWDTRSYGTYMKDTEGKTDEKETFSH